VERRQGDKQSSDDFTHDDPVVDEALAWFSRLQNISPDAETQAAFEAWLTQSPHHEREFRSLERMWGSPAFRSAAAALAAPTEPVELAVARDRKKGQPPRQWATRVTAAAAVVLLAIGVWQGPALLLRWEADYVTSTGERTTVALPDGSSMSLNTASAVAVDFRGARRNVRILAGEAYFDVKRDSTRPFHVAGQFGGVEVRGTAFSVRRDSGGDLIVLERGLVSVSRNADRAELQAGQMITATGLALSSVAPVDTESALAWREGRIFFSGKPFAQVIDELRRYYGGTIIIANGSVREHKVTGNYRLDDVEGALRTLADAVGITVHRLPGGIMIFR
jgi:transmembrane sensor